MIGWVLKAVIIMTAYNRLVESIGLTDLADTLPGSSDVTWAPVKYLTSTIKYLQPWWPKYQRFWQELGEYGLYTNDINQMWLFKHPRDDWRVMIYVLHDEVRFLYTTNTGTRRFSKYTVERGWLEAPGTNMAIPSCYAIPWALLLQIFVFARWVADDYDPERHPTIRDIFKHFQRVLRDFTPIENLNG